LFFVVYIKKTIFVKVFILNFLQNKLCKTMNFINIINNIPEIFVLRNMRVPLPLPVGVDMDLNEIDDIVYLNCKIDKHVMHNDYKEVYKSFFIAIKEAKHGQTRKTKKSKT
jgi:hypothetical protein